VIDRTRPLRVEPSLWLPAGQRTLASGHHDRHVRPRRLGVEGDLARAPHAPAFRRLTPEAESRTLRQRDARQVCHHPQLADLTLGIDPPPVLDDGLHRRTRLAPVRRRVTVQVLAPHVRTRALSLPARLVRLAGSHCGCRRPTPLDVRNGT